MSYQVLARKWRPKNFAQLMGQEHVVNVLENALAQERLHHAYLFTGTRGVGKTTIARIFAKSLNCQQGITKSPCGQCDVCLDIDDGRFVDLLEVDAASKTKVDDTREILENVQYAPSRGRFKVYLIDEVHMLSRSSFNALLKTLEEPPPHVKFILATTDPQKLPVTVLSRCLQFHLKALTRQQIQTKLEEILTAEHVEYDASALSLIAKAARGSMRDSLSLTDQAIAQGQGQITLANIQAMLGSIDQQWGNKLVIALLKKDNAELMQLSQQIASFAPSYHRLLAELIQLFHQIALWQLVPEATDVDDEQKKYLTHFAKAMSPEQVQLYYQIALQGRKDLPYSGDEQAGFDMVLLRLMAFAPAADAKALNSGLPQSGQTENKGQQAALESLSSLNEGVELTAPTVIENQPQTIEATKATPLPEPAIVDNSPEPLQLSSQPVQSATAQQAEQPDQEEPSTYHQVSHLMTDMFGEENQSPQYEAEQAAPAAVASSQVEQSENQNVSSALAVPSNPVATASQLDAEGNVSSETSEQVKILDLEQQSLEAEAFEEGIPGATPPQHQVEQLTAPQAQVDMGAPAQVQVNNQSDDVTSATAQVQSQPVVDETVKNALLQRNMLRSHKRQLEGGGKKSVATTSSPAKANVEQSGASNQGSPMKAYRQTTQAKQEIAQELQNPDVVPASITHSHDNSLNQLARPSVATIESQMHPEPEQQSIASAIAAPQSREGDFDPTTTDPTQIRQSVQVDTWSYIIDAMQLTGRLRQLAQNSEYRFDEHSNQCVLSVAQNVKHLSSGSAIDSLTKSLTLYYQKPIELVFDWVDKLTNSPQIIQQKIDKYRYDCAVELMHNDAHIGQLQTKFSAEIDNDSIQAC